MSESSLTPCLPFACQHNAVQRRHVHNGAYAGHWWECEHCGLAMHLMNCSDPGWDWTLRNTHVWVTDDPPRYEHACTLCNK